MVTRAVWWWPSVDLPVPEQRVVGTEIGTLDLDLQMCARGGVAYGTFAQPCRSRQMVGVGDQSSCAPKSLTISNQAIPAVGGDPIPDSS